MLPVVAEKLGLESSNKEGWLAGLCTSLLKYPLENQIELHVAYPVKKAEDGSRHRLELPEYGEGTVLYAYGFYEDVTNAERYDPALETRLADIIRSAAPDVIHCFGTEYGHTLAALRCCSGGECPPQGVRTGEPGAAASCGVSRARVLVGIQGVCHEAAEAYMADLPEQVQNTVTFRDWLKRDNLRQQQEKFFLRGEREKEILRLAENVTGRTAFDRSTAERLNPGISFFPMNETLRSCFYEGSWKQEACEPHRIFVSQGDYPLKGLHYLLLAAGKLQAQYPDLQIAIAGNSLVNYATLKDKIKISAYGKYLRRLIAEQKLEGKVLFLGRLTAQEMKEQYLRAGLYVCCSSNENSPNSLGEAMLLGMPCVAADVGGIPSMFTGGRDGILYEGFRADGHGQHLDRVAANLAGGITQMWEHPERQKEYVRHGREHAGETHDPEKNLRRLTEIYERIAGQSEAPGREGAVEYFRGCCPAKGNISERRAHKEKML